MGTVAGAPSIEISELIAEQIRAWRFKREIKHVTKAMKQLEDAGMEPKAVPMRTLAPLIEGGSLEEDDPMVDRWASLLANAAGGATTVPPSFPGILKELEPIEALMLDSAYELLMRLAPDLRMRYGVDHRGIMKSTGLSETDYRYHVDNLIRLRLVRGVFAADEARTVALTTFGQAFVRACRPPDRADPPITHTDEAEVRKIARKNRARWAAEAEGASVEE
jgi:hypothetical protein